MRHMLTSPHNVRKDALAHKPHAVEVVEVADKMTLSDGKRAIELYRIANTHAEGMLMGYVTDAKIGWATDIWSPGRDPVVPTAGQREVYAAVMKAGIAPERFAGGHGTSAPFSDLADKMRAAK